jgi:hypothetical protein
MIARIPVDDERIAAFCKRWGVRELALFGSVLRDDFGPDSDVDVLVTLSDDHGLTLLDLERMERELGEILGRTVDLWTRKGVQQSRNRRRSERILSTARVIHAA